MTIQELPLPPDNSELRSSSIPGSGIFRQLSQSVAQCKREGVTYASGTWGYTVLRTAQSPTANDLWPSALAKLHRWISKYLIHYERLGNDLADGRVWDELGRRFALDVDVTQPTLADLPDDLARATHEHVRALDAVFEDWVCRCALGGGAEGPAAAPAAAETAARFQRRYNPRFCDFLVVDEGALRSLAELPDETPSVESVGLRERLARRALHDSAYVWLVDSRAVRRFRGTTDGENYDGLMKLSIGSLVSAWFERLWRFEDDRAIFNREEFPEGSGELWYTSAPVGREVPPVDGDTTIPPGAPGYTDYITPLPEGKAGTVMEGTKLNCGVWYTVVEGDSCSSIAFGHRTTVAILIEANGALSGEGGCNEGLVVGRTYCAVPHVAWDSI
ncbi:hypothetical protein C8A00DRAFT_36859 [Chaetomidium leptoderma]|uniref:LysM domain-containing protein n=1 Tax=Chaetomidium leptoderma TaxID=669021 RepID=A0AAN6VFY2_9PEZI|nr:hypothetical protein C8A00DRAFT_36859 [Chaetomidium leptoderma]